MITRQITEVYVKQNITTPPHPPPRFFCAESLEILTCDNGSQARSDRVPTWEDFGKETARETGTIFDLHPTTAPWRHGERPFTIPAVHVGGKLLQLEKPAGGYAIGCLQLLGVKSAAAEREAVKRMFFFACALFYGFCNSLRFTTRHTDRHTHPRILQPVDGARASAVSVAASSSSMASPGRADEPDRTLFVGDLESRVREEILYELFLQVQGGRGGMDGAGEGPGEQTESAPDCGVE